VICIVVLAVIIKVLLWTQEREAALLGKLPWRTKKTESTVPVPVVARLALRTL